MVAYAAVGDSLIKLEARPNKASITVHRNGRRRTFWTDPKTAYERYLQLCKRANKGNSYGS